MDKETRDFLNSCLSRAAESIREGVLDAGRTARIEREVAQIRVNASAALERLEVGQVTAALTFKVRGTWGRHAPPVVQRKRATWCAMSIIPHKISLKVVPSSHIAEVLGLWNNDLELSFQLSAISDGNIFRKYLERNRPARFGPFAASSLRSLAVTRHSH